MHVSFGPATVISKPGGRDTTVRKSWFTLKAKLLLTGKDTDTAWFN